MKRPIRRPAQSGLHTPQDGGPSSTSSASAPTSRIRRFFLAKPALFGAIVVGCLLAFFLVRAIIDGDFNPIAKAPTYTTVLPKDKNINELGGWKLVSPPKKDPVFAYTDTIDSVPISVSQQPLPESFKNDVTGQVAELAQKFNATQKLSAGGVTVYIGASFKGPQSVIFVKNNVLILIKSEKKIQDTSWINYVQSLN